MFCPQNLLGNAVMSSFGALLHAEWIWVISLAFSLLSGSADQYPGWRVDTSNDSPITVSAAYRWVTTAVQTRKPNWKEAETYALFPVMIQPFDVLRYSAHRNGPALSRKSHEIIPPGDYALYATGVFTYQVRVCHIQSPGDLSDSRLYSFFQPISSFLRMEKTVELNSPALATKVRQCRKFCS
jgi:hypothetical protein